MTLGELLNQLDVDVITGNAIRIMFALAIVDGISGLFRAYWDRKTTFRYRKLDAWGDRLATRLLPITLILLIGQEIGYVEAFGLRLSIVTFAGIMAGTWWAIKEMISIVENFNPRSVDKEPV